MSTTLPVVEALPVAEMHRLAAVYRLHNEPLPTKDAVAFVVEKDGKIVASMTFHQIKMIGLTHSQDDEAMKLLQAAVSEFFSAGEHLFTVVENEWGRIEAEMAGMVAVPGQLMRKDFR